MHSHVSEEELCSVPVDDIAAVLRLLQLALEVAHDDEVRQGPSMLQSPCATGNRRFPFPHAQEASQDKAARAKETADEAVREALRWRHDAETLAQQKKELRVRLL